MSEREALYAAICADPWADLPRLVFADWLDDCGEADHAAFIRTGVHLARERSYGRRPEVAGMPRPAALVSRPLTDAPPGVTYTRFWDRGFVAGVELLRVADLTTHGEAIHRAIPLASVKVRGRSKSRATGFEAFAASPVLAQVRQLDFYRVPLGDAGAEILARSPRLHGLRRLDLRYVELTDAGIRTLTNAPWFPTLQRLDIDGNPFTAAGVETLLQLGTNCDLTHFRLTNWRELFSEIVAPARDMWDANHARLAAAGRLYEPS